MQVLLHANVLELVPSREGTVVLRALLGSLDGRRGVVRARQFVLAAGGIDNARLLLLSDSVTRRGLGNDRDRVGRCFMDHPGGPVGFVVSPEAQRRLEPYDNHLVGGPTPSIPEMALSAAAQRQYRILNARVRPLAVEEEVPPGIVALRSLRAALRPEALDEASRLERRLCVALANGSSCHDDLREAKMGVGRAAVQLALHPRDVLRALSRKLAGRRAIASRAMRLMGYFEQAPNDDSRVLLDDSRDALGLRRARVDWRLTELDLRSFRTAATLAGEAVARACHGRFAPERWVVDTGGSPPPLRGTAHHLGTTRMADDASRGVVDRHCRVFTVDNLHIAGSSVFATGSWAFPTFTIVALSLRLGERLRMALTRREAHELREVRAQ